eukprot:scaffold7777_cov471-Prasinococcus_capsulatus_cf.AAC.4
MCARRSLRVGACVLAAAATTCADDPRAYWRLLLLAFAHLAGGEPVAPPDAPAGCLVLSAAAQWTALILQVRCRSRTAPCPARQDEEATAASAPATAPVPRWARLRGCIQRAALRRARAGGGAGGGDHALPQPLRGDHLHAGAHRAAARWRGLSAHAPQPLARPPPDRRQHRGTAHLPRSRQQESSEASLRRRAMLKRKAAVRVAVLARRGIFGRT